MKSVMTGRTITFEAPVNVSAGALLSAKHLIHLTFVNIIFTRGAVVPGWTAVANK